MKNKQRKPLKSLIFFVGLFVMFAWLANPALAQDDSALSEPDTSDVYLDENEDAESFDGGDGVTAFGLGTQDYWTAAMEWDAQNGLDRWQYLTFTFYYAPNGGVFNKQVELPWGARMTILECFFNDTVGANGNVRMWKNTQVYFGNGRNNELKATVASAGAGGFQWPFVNINQLTKFREGNNRNYFWLQATMPATSGVSLRGCRIFWNKVVRTGLPNPFGDIGGLNSRFQNAIKALAFSGITGGCAPGLYCPGAPVTRGQMAVFLAEALGLHWPN